MEFKELKTINDQIKFIKRYLKKYGSISIPTGPLTKFQKKEFKKYFSYRPTNFNGYTYFVFRGRKCEKCNGTLTAKNVFGEKCEECYIASIVD
jgi:hypothetical protein